MILTAAYLLAIFFELLFVIGFTIYTIFLIYSNLKGSPYVPTKGKEADLILKEANLVKNSLFFDLGCGNGQIVRKAVSQYKVRGVGVDVNPLLLLIASTITKLRHLKNIKYKQENILDTDISKADTVYLFLMPRLIEKLVPKLERELKKEALVISHGFKINGWEKYLRKTIDNKPFPTYFYRR